jgi:phosphoribosylformylglycinamidine cyclo-ligase
VFGLLKNNGKVPDIDMRSTFNMGIGYIIIVPEDSASTAVEVLAKAGYPAYVMGTIKKGGEGVEYVQA